MVSHLQRALAACALGASFWLVLAAPAAAHVFEHAGPYTIEVGWQHEPAYVGAPNAVQVVITRDGKPVTDLKGDELVAVVSTGGRQSGQLAFTAGFDPEELEGNLGEYDAAIVPTAPGDYAFHVTGTIHGQPVDVSVTSGPDTFDGVTGTADVEFPASLPTVPEIVTRLDRIDARLGGAAGGPAVQASIDAATAAAADARSAADRALLLGAALGGAGLVVALGAILVAARTARRARHQA